MVTAAVSTSIGRGRNPAIDGGEQADAEQPDESCGATAPALRPAAILGGGGWGGWGVHGGDSVARFQHAEQIEMRRPRLTTAKETVEETSTTSTAVA